MIAVKKTAILPDETSEALTARLAELGAELLSETVHAAETGTIQAVPQDAAQATKAVRLAVIVPSPIQSQWDGRGNSPAHASACRPPPAAP